MTSAIWVGERNPSDIKPAERAVIENAICLQVCSNNINIII